MITTARPSDPTPNKGDAGSLTIVAYDTGPLVSVSTQTVRVSISTQNFPPILTIMPMEFHLQHWAIKGTLVVSLNIVTRPIHIRLFARLVHNARTPPTAAAAILPARLRRSLPSRLRCSLPAAALLFSRPTAPCMTTVTRTRLLACRRLPDQPKDGWRGSVDVVPDHDDKPSASGHEPTWIRTLRPSREQLLHLRQRLVLPEPPTPSGSSATKSAIYTCQCLLGRHALIVHL
jgi:hypothetical protein